MQQRNADRTKARILAAAIEEFSARGIAGARVDRIAEVAMTSGWADGDIVVNLQGDEPLMPPVLLQQVAELLAAHPGAAIATLASRIGNVAMLLDLNYVKVVTDTAGRALYFSRAPIPFGRDTAAAR